MEMMDMAADDTREELRRKLRSNFDGRIVRKDLTKKIKEGANVPVYVLEFLLGQYCSSDDETIIEQGVQNVKRILADNFVRPDEAQKILSQLRKNGSHTIIDMVTVHLDIKKDCFFAEFSNLGLTNVPITDDYPEKYDRLLCGGIWCIVQLEYESEGDSSFGITDIDGQPISSKQKKQKDISPISIHKLTPIQMPHIDIEEVAVLGEISISGTILKVDELANSLQVCLDSGAKKVLLPITSAADLGTVPPELVGSFNLIFYSSAEDAVFKALGVE